jgi:CDGSH-type Zn-finger protein/uncharacterized Fe-S cluster protein YjdI
VSQRTYEGEGIAVHWDSSLCIHSKRCIAAQPSVFDVDRRPWIAVTAADAVAIADAVARCPTGALRYTRRDGAPGEVPRRPTEIVPDDDGPLRIAGDLRIAGPHGELLAETTRISLCRCGQSQNKPFCDNHHLAGFSSNRYAKRLDAGTPLDSDSGPTTITATADGPLHVEGRAVVTSPAGEQLAEAGELWLCRCGRSRSKPFCDGSHRQASP